MWPTLYKYKSNNKNVGALQGERVNPEESIWTTDVV